MPTNITHQRVDEVGKYYKPITRLSKISGILFWVIATASLALPYAKLLLETAEHEIATAFFLVLTLFYFTLGQFSRFYLVPKAERMRRKQLLSDAFGTHLINERTSLYYNNNYSPSVKRLGANILENALFSKEIAAAMLVSRRLIVGIYLFIWTLFAILNRGNLELLAWITQLVFSMEILAGWLTLESLRFRHERTFEQLHAHFLYEIGDNDPQAVANVLDALVAYESTKSSSGILLSSKIFHKLNPVLTNKWEQIKNDVGI